MTVLGGDFQVLGGPAKQWRTGRCPPREEGGGGGPGRGEGVERVQIPRGQPEESMR